MFAAKLTLDTSLHTAQIEDLPVEKFAGSLAFF